MASTASGWLSSKTSPAGLGPAWLHQECDSAVFSGGPKGTVNSKGAGRNWEGHSPFLQNTPHSPAHVPPTLRAPRTDPLSSEDETVTPEILLGPHRVMEGSS